MNKLLTLVLAFGISGSMLASDFSDANPHTISLWQTPLNILPGDSTTALMRYRLPGIDQVTALKVSLTGSGAQECAAMVRDVEVEFVRGAIRKFFKLDRNGMINFKKPGFAGFVLNFRNFQVFSVPCNLDVRAVIGASVVEPVEPKPPVTSVKVDEFKFVGVLRYRGGFANTLTVPIQSTGKATHFLLRTPEFCKGLEILAAEYGKLGEYWVSQKFKPIQDSYSIGTDGIAGIDSLRLIANGPVELQCDIPVYLRTEEPASGGGSGGGGGGEPFRP